MGFWHFVLHDQLLTKLQALVYDILPLPESETWSVAYYVSLDKFIVLSRSGATETNKIQNNIIPDLRISAAGMHWIVGYVYSVTRKCVQLIVALRPQRP